MRSRQTAHSMHAIMTVVITCGHGNKPVQRARERPDSRDASQPDVSWRAVRRIIAKTRKAVTSVRIEIVRRTIG